MLSAKATMRNTTLNIHAPDALTIQTFEHHFCHLLMILLDNAIETAQERNLNDALIHVTMTLKETHEFHLIVEDTCGGIWQKPLESIFEFQSSRQSDELSPRGMGLFMFKTILETFFQGKIAVSNTPRGARFEIVFPLR